MNEEELRARAARIVANWRVNFDADDDRPLINMIETHLRHVANSLAAKELREAAARWRWFDGVTAVPSGELRARADALTRTQPDNDTARKDEG